MRITPKAYCEPNNIMEKVVMLTNESLLNPVGDTSNLLCSRFWNLRNIEVYCDPYEAVKYITYLVLIGEQVLLLWFTVHFSIFIRCKNVCTITCKNCRESLSKVMFQQLILCKKYQWWMNMCTWSCFYQGCC